MQHQRFSCRNRYLAQINKSVAIPPVSETVRDPHLQIGSGGVPTTDQVTTAQNGSVLDEGRSIN